MKKSDFRVLTAQIGYYCALVDYQIELLRADVLLTSMALCA